MEKRPGEIDFYELLVKIVLFFKAHLLVFFVCLVVGISLSVVRLKIRRPMYTGSMIVTSRIAPALITDHMLQRLNFLIEDREVDSLSRVLQLTRNQAAAIVNISVDGSGRSSLVLPDTIFRISVNVRDRSFVTRLQNGITGYLESDRHVLLQKHAGRNALTVVSDLVFSRHASLMNHPVAAAGIGAAAGLMLAFGYLGIRLVIRIART